MAALVLIELILRAINPDDDDDDQGGGKAIPLYAPSGALHVSDCFRTHFSSIYLHQCRSIRFSIVHGINCMNLHSFVQLVSPQVL